MRKDADEMDQFLEQIEDRLALRAIAARDDFPTFPLTFDQQLSSGNRLDDPNRMSGGEVLDLIANGRERGALNLDQQLAPYRVDAISIDRDFLAVGSVELLELPVQSRFHSMPQPPIIGLSAVAYLINRGTNR